MAEKHEYYKCGICGNLVFVAESGTGELVCCGKPMERLKAHAKADEGREKHVPVMSASGQKVLVKVGSVPHPMDEKHFIESIEVLAGGRVAQQKQLLPGEKPEATFFIEGKRGAGEISARCVCNIHGLWKS